MYDDDNDSVWDITTLCISVGTASSGSVWKIASAFAGGSDVVAMCEFASIVVVVKSRVIIVKLNMMVVTLELLKLPLNPSNYIIVQFPL